jgi:hypothetical protein
MNLNDLPVALEDRVESLLLLALAWGLILPPRLL